MTSTAGVQQAHIKTAEYLQQQQQQQEGRGLEYIILRQGIYAESWWLYAGFQPQRFKTGDIDPITFVIPDDGPIAWVSWDDLAEGTAKILARIVSGDRTWIGKTLNLTGSKTYTLKQVAGLLQEHVGRAVYVDVVGREEARKVHSGNAAREAWVVESWSGWFEAIREGECSVVDPLLEEVLGREVRCLEELAGELFEPV